MFSRAGKSTVSQYLAFSNAAGLLKDYVEEETDEEDMTMILGGK